MQHKASHKTIELTWTRYHRIINSAFPPKDLFDDISDPEDWMLLGSSESKTNSRLSESAGNLDLIPTTRRVKGPGSNYVMAPFTHISTDRPGRFHDGTFGAFYAANKFETAVIETAYHYSKFYSATNESTAWIVEMRELTGSIHSKVVDIRTGNYNDLLDPESYSHSQRFATEIRSKSYEGIVYPSVRDKSGECIAMFYPDTITIPTQGKHLLYHWDGNRIDQIKIMGTENLVYKITQ